MRRISITFALLFGLTLALPAQRGEQLNEDRPLFFISRIISHGGRALHLLEQSKLEVSRDTDVIRCTYQNRSGSPVSISLFRFADRISVEYVTLIDGDLSTKKSELPRNSPTWERFEKSYISANSENSQFWKTLSSFEEEFFGSVFGGDLILFEHSDNGVYKVFAIVDHDIEIPAKLKAKVRGTGLYREFRDAFISLAFEVAE